MNHVAWCRLHFAVFFNLTFSSYFFHLLTFFVVPVFHLMWLVWLHFASWPPIGLYFIECCVQFKVKRNVSLLTFLGLNIYLLPLAPLHGKNQNSSSLQLEVAYWPVLAVGTVAHLADARCLIQWCLKPQSAVGQSLQVGRPPVPQPAALSLWLSSCNVLWQWLIILHVVIKCYQSVIAVL